MRCTSAPGYQLPGGADTDRQLREEVMSCKVFVGLITDSSIESAYVLFELGARWGADLILIPVLAGGADPSALKGPLSGINALRCDQPANIHQLIEDISKHLDQEAEPPKSYQSQLEELIEANHELSQARGELNTISTSKELPTLLIASPSPDTYQGLYDDEIRYLMALSRPRNCRQAITGDLPSHLTREDLRYQEMLDKYVEMEFFRHTIQGYVFAGKGFEAADELWRIFILRELADWKKEKEMDYCEFEKLLHKVVLTDGPSESDELVRHLKDIGERELAELVPVDGGKSGSRITETGMSFLRPYFQIQFRGKPLTEL